MTSNVIKQNSTLTTRQCAEKWNTDADNVAKWCREGVIPGAEHKGLGKRWFIPSDAMRPLDKVIACEILWQIIECQMGNQTQVDLSRWGFPDEEGVKACIQVLSEEGYIQKQDGSWRIKQLGMSLLGRSLPEGGKVATFQIMMWSEAAGSFVGAVVGTAFKTAIS